MSQISAPTTPSPLRAVLANLLGLFLGLAGVVAVNVAAWVGHPGIAVTGATVAVGGYFLATSGA